MSTAPPQSDDLSNARGQDVAWHGGPVCEPEPPAWPTVPVGSVRRVSEATAAAVLRRDPAPADWPLLIGVSVDCGPARQLVTSVITELHQVAVRVFPAWLDTAATVDGSTDLDVAAVRALATRFCQESLDYAPYLGELAATAVTGADWRVDCGLDLTAQILGVARVLARAYARESIVVILQSNESHAVSIADQTALAQAASWLAEHGRIVVWLTQSTAPDIDRFSWLNSLSAHARADRPDVADEPTGSAVSIAPLRGMPAPNSPAEQALERALARTTWAGARCWNTLLDNRSHLDAPMRIDVLWRDARLAVEIDGPDHRGVDKYAADRRRDNMLQRVGYVVLRFTNEQVLDDVGLVVAEIESMVAVRTSGPTS
ncbi:endonuclease domain-containing protein [Williamsia sp. CHRR-6]|uniref:endonuclease domain-containing protein n=1 Tax=Williamsia sp. CHRR-6 TaxID=2835871 RepID=UPI001BD9D298|nr:DUF559 domain-containing protein [Williamsia sp. CHRR-6]MBT0565728.1 DUF559 domain-containing protein [Williamsia sp. CHRR-6]